MKRLSTVILKFDDQIVWTGLFSALFGVTFKLLNCFMRHNLFEGRRKAFTYIVSAALSSYILAYLCFTKAYRKLLMHLALALAFECLFKLTFARRNRDPEKLNKFQTDYVQVRNPKTGEMVNQFVPPHLRKKASKLQDGSRFFDKQTLSIRLTELVIAGLLSVAVQNLNTRIEIDQII
uniref:Uncharacterized protein n=1 Tax=Strombidium rassoulzadegani TaxID=1082188 RepID=A0A7S3FVJ5_9SPIT|mmetsp:Transcript_1615/g.2853  ORF Transcript_1615/g.2853 Transcript_1615/m.2853 type:complete len:178 (+) Transcript_1615:739-1272(+)